MKLKFFWKGEVKLQHEFEVEANGKNLAKEIANSKAMVCDGELAQWIKDALENAVGGDITVTQVDAGFEECNNA